MAYSDLKKIHSEKRTRLRNLNDIRTKASKKLKETRKSNREAVLNLHRHVETIPEVKRKKTEQEEKLLRLKAYKEEKLKQLAEQKKSQKPPFYSLVRTRHTGGTPFRFTQPMKMPILSLRPVTRSRTAFQKEFEFKGKLNDQKEQSKSPLKAAISKLTKYKENQPVENNFKFHLKEPVAKKEIKQKPIVLFKTDANEGIQYKKKPLLKSTTDQSQKRRNGGKTKPVAVVCPKAAVKKGKKIIEKNVSNSSKQLSSDDGTSSEHNTNKENLEKSNTIEVQKAGDILADRLADHVFIMSPLNTCKKVTRSTRRRPRPSAEAGLSCEIIQICDIEVRKNEGKDNQIGINKSMEDRDDMGPEVLSNKLNEETKRLDDLADVWYKRCTENIPEHVKDEIFAVVGQTRLLISDKFQQFQSLINNALSKHEETSVVIKSDDLLGFWEMMYLEVEQLNRRYQVLEELKNNKWCCVDKATETNKSKKKIKVKKSTKPTSSKFREFLKEKKKCENSNEDINKKDTPIKKTPSVMRNFCSEFRKSRSSASSITLQKSFLAKAVLSPFTK